MFCSDGLLVFDSHGIQVVSDLAVLGSGGLLVSGFATPLGGVLDPEAMLKSLAFDVLFLVHQHVLLLLVFGIDKNLPDMSGRGCLC